MAQDAEKLKLREHLKSLGVKNGYWTGSDGERYKVCHQGMFYIHTITVTRIPDAYDACPSWDYTGSDFDWLKKEGKAVDGSSRQVCYERLKDSEGRNTYSVDYRTPEEFDILFNQFLLGYKEYQALVKKTAIEDDFA